MSRLDYQLSHLSVTPAEAILVESINEYSKSVGRIDDFICVRPAKRKNTFTVSRYTGFDFLVEFELTYREFYADIEDEFRTHELELIELDYFTGNRIPTITNRFKCDAILGCIKNYVCSAEFSKRKLALK